MTDWPLEVPGGAWEALACPHCQHQLRLDGGLTCQEGHHFDLARQRYVSLLSATSRTDTADTAEMVTARAAFLSSGLYQPIAAAVASVCADIRGLIVDIGAGTGYYLAAAVAAGGDPTASANGIAIDSSKFAARQAARSSPRVLAVVADAWTRLPLVDRAAGGVLNVFAPRQMAEIQRILRPGGRLITVTPQPDHLAELIDGFGMLRVGADKTEKLTRSAGGLRRVGQQILRYQIRPTATDLTNLVMMGPSARHVNADDVIAQAREYADQDVTVAVSVMVFAKPRPRPIARTSLGVRKSVRA